MSSAFCLKVSMRFCVDFNDDEYSDLVNSNKLSSAKKYLGVAFEEPSSLLNYLDDNTFIGICIRSRIVEIPNKILIKIFYNKNRH